MKRLLILGATGNLGGVLAGQALAAGHDVTALIRDPGRLAPSLAARVTLHRGELHALPLAALSALMEGQDAVINTAGHVADGEAFARVFDRVATAAEALAAPPVVWFLSGAAALDLDDRGRKGLDLPLIARRYAVHGQNLARLQRGRLDWRLLCPGPMVDEPAVGLGRLRLSVDRFPVPLPGWTAPAPAAAVLPFFVAAVGQITIPYADAAAVMLANLAPGGPMARRRIGIALPEGLTKRKTG
jgi:putative NADH-flavin reductase